MLPRELFAAWTTAQQIGLSEPANWGTAARAAPPHTPGWSPRELGFVCLLRSVPGGGAVQVEWTAMVGGPFCKRLVMVKS